MNSTTESKTRQRMRKDTQMRIAVKAFGGLVLLTMLVLIAHLISQALPLALTPQLTAQVTLKAPDNTRIIGGGDLAEGQPAMLMTQQCSVALAQLQHNQLAISRTLRRPCDHEADVVTLAGEHYLVTVSASGLLRLSAVRGLHSQADDQAVATMSGWQDKLGLSFALPKTQWQQRSDWRVSLSDKWVVAIIDSPEATLVRWIEQDHPTRFYDQRFPPKTRLLPLPNIGQLAVLTDQALSFVDVKGNTLNRIKLPEPIVWWQTIAKNRTLFTASKDASVTRWVLHNDKGMLSFVPTYTFASKGNPLAVAAHPSSNAMALSTESGHLLLLNRVSGEVVSETPINVPAPMMSWYADRLYLFSSSQLTHYQIDHLSGITTWASLFVPQQYEGYIAPRPIWQTSSASDFQEQKFGLTPLIIGSLKASLLALLVAIPLSLGAAIYTGFFARSRLRQAVKPAIELLEAIPSVLIGFIAAIWLSPLAAKLLFGIAFFLVTVPFILVMAAIIQQYVALRWASWRPGLELLVAIAGILLLGYISMVWAPGWVLSVMGESDIAALSTHTHSPVGKTAIVVAIALGIAISPSIYSLTEDAIAGVPDDLKRASFALGATRLQTLRRVVLHVAMPGMMAATMFGFGRAFGETMIVLMVTGNTPIASWDLLEGLRALTANLTIELPEADVGSTHYQILFFTACILFTFTFVVNTVAELLRQRLRRRLGDD